MPYFKTSNNIAIHYQEYGDLNNPPIILIHGLASNLEIWQPQIVELKEHYRVYALDLPGHGKSGRMETYNVHDIPQMMFEFIQVMQLEKVRLMGLSIGSTISLLFALTYPELTDCLVLQGPSGGLESFSSPKGWMSYLQLTLTLKAVLLMWALLGRKTSGKIINFFGKTYQYSTLLIGMEEEVDSKALTGYAYSNQNAPYQGRLDKITIPILIIRGLDDQFARSYSQYIKENVKGPCYWLEVPLTEHLVGLEKPVEFNMASTAFLKKVQKVDSATIIKAAEHSKGLFKW